MNNLQKLSAKGNKINIDGKEGRLFYFFAYNEVNIKSKVNSMSEKWVWWKHGVIYQIYPRSFQDSNGDGVGDIQGIISRLDYLEELGIDAIWISPIYKSPMVDFGYDISDYREIDPVFGTFEDMNELITRAHEKSIRIIMDMVLNHTSNEHRWFIESRSSKRSPYRDYYIWEDPKGGREPNNWKAAFGGNAWEFDEQTGQYYMHSFKAQQPDLNWRNPKVVEGLFADVAFWLELGIDGFRLDVINHIIKDRELRNNPFTVGASVRPYDMQRHLYDRNQEDSHDSIRDFRRLIDSYPGKMLVGEINVEQPGEPDIAASYLGDDQLHLTFDFSFIWTVWDAQEFKKRAMKWYASIGDDRWPAWVLSNHDQKRAYSRYGNHEQRAKIAALFLLMQRGTPFIYYGEEIGMRHKIVDHKHIVDPPGLQYWPFYWGRDPDRLPMQWDDSHNLGFSDNEQTWLPVDEKWGSDHNVARQSDEAGSLLSWYREILTIRRKYRTLYGGDIRFLDVPEKDILCFFRHEEQRILCILNFNRFARKIDPDVVLYGQWDRILLQRSDMDYDTFEKLAGYEAMIVLLK